MSTHTMPDIPDPGSDEADALGCTCPRMDNAYGRGYMGGVKDENGETMFVYRTDCPVHSALLRAIEAQGGET